MQFGTLRVFNDDRLVPGAIWPMHPHKDIEGLTYVVEGSFRHEDDVGGAPGPLPAGSVQRMTLGRGAWHSEQNASETEPMRFIQMWIMPAERGLEPGVEQKVFTEEDRTDRLLKVISGDGGDAVLVHQDAHVFVSRLRPGLDGDARARDGPRRLPLRDRGDADVAGERMTTGDAAEIWDEPSIAIHAHAADRAHPRRRRAAPEPCFALDARVRVRPMRIHATILLVTSALVAPLLVAGPSLASRPAERRGADSPRTRALPALVAARTPDELSRALSQGRISARGTRSNARDPCSTRGVRARSAGYRDRTPDPRPCCCEISPSVSVSSRDGLERSQIACSPARPTVPATRSVMGTWCRRSRRSVPRTSASTTSPRRPMRRTRRISTPAACPTTSRPSRASLDEVWADGGRRARLSRAQVGRHLATNDGGSALLDVYLVDIGGDGLYGYCASDDPHLDPPTATGTCRRTVSSTTTTTFSQFGYPDPMRPLKVTAAHEFFHAVQFAYDIGEDGWLMESTATWMEEHVYDPINDNRQYLATSPLAQPLIPLDRTRGLRVYGAWIFWQFLTEYLGWRGARPEHRPRGMEESRRQPRWSGHVFDAGARIRRGGSDPRRDALAFPMGLRGLRRLERPPGEVLRRRGCVPDGAVSPGPRPSPGPHRR